MIPCFDIDRSIPFRLLVVSGFSGSGKGSVLDQFSEEQRTVFGIPIEVVTSYTTRQPRHSGEKYHFVTPQVFMDMVQTDQILEYNDAYSNNSYGTPIQGVRDVLRQGRIPCLEINCTGLEKNFPMTKLIPVRSCSFSLPHLPTSYMTGSASVGRKCKNKFRDIFNTQIKTRSILNRSF